LDTQSLDKLEVLRNSPAFERFKGLLEKNEGSPTYAVIQNLYNKYLGKEAINLQDVVQSIIKDKLVNKKDNSKNKFGLDLQTIDDLAKLSWTIEMQIEKMEKEATFYDMFVEKNKGIFRVGETGGWSELSKQMNERRRMLEDLENKRLTNIKRRVDELKAQFNFSESQTNKIVDIIESSLFRGAKKEHNRTKRKAHEISELLDLLEKYGDGVRDIQTFIDMAGGAGDLGLAIAEEYNDHEAKVRVVDVMPVLEGYNEYLRQASLYTETAERVSFELVPLQEIDIKEEERGQTALVAKHPCGGLKDDIITLAIDNEIPFVMIMTCCQDKICKHAETYFPLYQSTDIPNIDTFKKVLKTSARTNIEPDTFIDNLNQYEKMRKEREGGDKAMDLLDSISAERLRKAGYNVVIEKVGGGKINKGNVIVAVKRKK